MLLNRPRGFCTCTSHVQPYMAMHDSLLMQAFYTYFGLDLTRYILFFMYQTAASVSKHCGFSSSVYQTYILNPHL